MSIFFANFKVILLSPEEFIDPSLDIEAKRDDLGGYTLLVDRGGENFQNIFGEQRWFTKKERQQIKLFVIGEFLKRHASARSKYLPGVDDSDGVDIEIARLAEEDKERWEW